MTEIWANESILEDNNYFYSVLNLNKGASQNEINDRYRALSLIFHPDKQHDDASREIATEQFLEVQKAYEVLSEPFLRQVYDTLGPEGLSVVWSEAGRPKTESEKRVMFKSVLEDLNWKRQQSKALIQGKVTSTILADSLFYPFEDERSEHWISRFLSRLGKVERVSSMISYSIKKRLSDKTVVTFETRLDESAGDGSTSKFYGTVRHQFSPRLFSTARISPIYPNFTKLTTSYSNGVTSVDVKWAFVPTSFHSMHRSFSISVARRLHRFGSEQGKLTFQVTKVPRLAFHLVWPSAFGSVQKDTEDLGHDGREKALPSISGLRSGSIYRSCGIAFVSIFPIFVAEAGIVLSELASTLMVSLEWSFSGLSLIFAGTWSNKSSTISAKTVLNSFSTQLILDFSYLEQQFSLPIILSKEPIFEVQLWSVIIPSTTALLGYHFILKPLRRARRLECVRLARKMLDEDSNAYKGHRAVHSLLKDAAKKYTKIENSIEGLVVQDAAYGPMDTDEGAQELNIDVTIPLQALVRNSQLYIPGGKSKAGLQGFIDPAPFTPKSLRIHYLFRGRMHYAEIPDYLPLVLPLAEHGVDQNPRTPTGNQNRDKSSRQK